MSKGAEVSFHAARERIQRMLYLASGVGAVMYGLLLAPRILAQVDSLQPVYAAAGVVVGLLLPVSLIVLSFTLPMRTLNVYAAGMVVTFILTQVLWLPSMTVEATAAPPWLQGVTGIHGIIGAIAWRHRLVWIYALVQGVVVAYLRLASTGRDVEASLLDGAGALTFNAILIGVALALVGAAQQQDLVAARARAHASMEAGKRTREREQTRINAIVHDDIMSVLLVASREEPSRRLAEQAESALASIAMLTVDPDEAPDYEPAEAITAMRSVVSEHAGQVAFWHSSTATATVPADVVEAFTESIGEAVRNSLLHAGDPGQFVHRVVTVNLTDYSLRATIQDTGRGFNPRSIAARRLGIRVSILERMHLLDGGSASIDSRPGRGTTVALTWVRPS